MKVICIDASEGRLPPHGILKEGATYHVIGKKTFSGELNYQLAECPIWMDYDVYFKAKRFMPLSDIDEAELANERELIHQNK